MLMLDILLTSYMRIPVGPNSGIYEQIKGIAMGSNASVHLAMLVALRVDRKIAQQHPSCIIARYVDDIFIIANDSVSEQQVIADLSAEYRRIRLNLIWEPKANIQSFLDVTLDFTNGFMHSYPNFKKLAAYAYPHFDSNVPNSIKKGFIVGECLRYRRLSSDRRSYEYCRYLFAHRLRQRNYPMHYIIEIMEPLTWKPDTARVWTPTLKIRDKAPLYMALTYDRSLHHCLTTRTIFEKLRHLLPLPLQQATFVQAWKVLPSAFATLSKLGRRKPGLGKSPTETSRDANRGLNPNDATRAALTSADLEIIMILNTWQSTS